MGSSYVDFRERGFWTRDSGAEVWLYLVCAEIDRLESTPDWLRDAREHWFIQATAGVNGCILPNFDDHLGAHDDRVEEVLRLAGQAEERVRAYGEVIPKDEINAWGTGGTGWFIGPVDTSWVLECFDWFGRLLRGEDVEQWDVVIRGTSHRT